MTATKAAGVRVRGSCKNGHITETVADRGRVTAQVVCSHDGCEQKVNCRRIPKDATPPPPPASDGTTRVVRIADYDATSSGAQGDDGGFAVVPVTDPEPDPEPGGGPGADPGSAPPADPLADDGERRGIRHRFRERRRAEAVRSARREWQHPLGI